MKIIAIALSFVAVLSSPVFSNELFFEAGPGFAKSLHEEIVCLRYRRNASPLFNRDSYWESTLAYWNNGNHAWAAGVARGIAWNKQGARSFTAALGVVLLDRTTENLGTRWQFFLRFAYDFNLSGQNLSAALIHYSNGKKIFGWQGPNNGENFITLSIGLF